MLAIVFRRRDPMCKCVGVRRLSRRKFIGRICRSTPTEQLGTLLLSMRYLLAFGWFAEESPFSFTKRWSSAAGTTASSSSTRAKRWTWSLLRWHLPLGLISNLMAAGYWKNKLKTQIKRSVWREYLYFRFVFLKSIRHLKLLTLIATIFVWAF